MKLLTIDQLSETLNVKKKTIYDWTHKGLIPYKRAGRLLRFDLNDIERWLKNKKSTKITRN
jgi:excisionase family DNA binding protein